jgi:Ca-activated chloride channel homolog
MRRFSWFWSFVVAAAIVGCLAVAWANEPTPSSPPQKQAKEQSPLGKLLSSEPPEKSHRRKPAKKSPVPRERPIPAAPMEFSAPAAGIFPPANFENGVADEKNEPVAFTSKEGVKGWSIAIPGRQAVPTPAVVDNRVFIGGGISSHDFGALDAKTGQLVWHYRATDNGPTAPVVTSDYVIFNTESCDLEVLYTTGKRLWKKRIANSLMSTPAAADERIVTSCPIDGGRFNVIAAYDQETGKPLWQRKVSNEVIYSPVIDGGKVYAATIGGNVYCLKASNGEVVWAEMGANATSTPTVWHDRCWFSQRQEIVSAGRHGPTVRQIERIAVRGLTPSSKVRGLAVTSRSADYLECRSRYSAAGRMVAPPRANVARPLVSADASDPETEQVADESGAGDPPAANSRRMNAGKRATLVGLNTLDVWSYQGSRPLFYKGRLYAAMGDTLTCVDPKTEKVVWEKDFRSERQSASRMSKSQNDERSPHPTIAPPVLVNDKVFVGTDYGVVTCLSAATGEFLWQATIKDPILTQPVVACGRVYVATQAGRLFCLETGDHGDDGWLMWGANAAHTGRVSGEDDEGSEEARHSAALPERLADSRD